MLEKLTFVLKSSTSLQKISLFCLRSSYGQLFILNTCNTPNQNFFKILNLNKLLKLQDFKKLSNNLISVKNGIKVLRSRKLTNCINMSENVRCENKNNVVLSGQINAVPRISALKTEDIDLNAYKRNLYQRKVTSRKRSKRVSGNKGIISNVDSRSVGIIGDAAHSNPKNQLLSTSNQSSSVLNNSIRFSSTISSCDSKNLEEDNAPFTVQSLPSEDGGLKLNVMPKNILHNAYDVIASQLNNKEFKVQPSYTLVKVKNKNSMWCCSYNIKWPESMKFVSMGQTKQEASHKAALSALIWLRKNEKITKDGHPIIVGKNEAAAIVKQSLPTLTLDHYTRDQMACIVNIYTTEFLPLLQQNIDNRQNDDGKFSKSDYFDLNDVNGNLKQKLLSPSRYIAKEKTSLPISKYKGEFTDLLKDNRIIIIKGEPGCGKSTRIPQYVLEAWAKDGLDKGEPCRIAVTQPRRIAAISLAERVSDERDERSGHIVGYQIRLKSNFNPATGRILYCTTGILLKHLQSDIHLENFTHVILDEAHERDVNTDLLLNLLRSALSTNNKLKLIIMSATIDVDLFKNYMNDAPVMHIPGFTYPVKSYFLDHCNSLDLSKTLKMCSNVESPAVVHEDVAKVIEHIHRTKSEGAILCFLPGWEDIVKVQKLIPTSNDMTVLCLHSRLQDSDQKKIFSKPPPGIRKVILSTNIAETSVTIDDVVYVVDTGIHKENRFDNDKGIACIDNYWVSQSSMIQRKGRAGRVQPGECFHLYTKSKFENFNKFTDPEILKTSLTKILLNSKVYSNNMDALLFMSQLPTPPEKAATIRAVRELKELQLLDDEENLTSLGRTLANFQLEPKLAKILVNAVVYKCVTPIVDIVTIFSSDTELFNNGLVDKEKVKKIKTVSSRYSDHLAMMRLFEAWLECMEEYGSDAAERYCSDTHLVHHKLVTLNKLRKIHFDYLYNGLHDTLPIADNYSDNDELVKAILLSGVGTLLTHRTWDIVKGRYKKGNVFLTSRNQKATIASESVNFKKTSFPSSFFVYFNELRSNIRRTTLVRECSAITPMAVLLFSDKQLVIKEVESEDEKVILSLKDTKIEFLCSKQDAVQITNCKENLQSAYSYFIFQMTQGGERISCVNEIWDKILERVNSVLLKHSIK